MEEHTTLTVSKLLEFSLNATYLAYRGNKYQETFGTAMGSPVSVTVAILVMEDIEEKAVSEFTPADFLEKIMRMTYAQIPFLDSLIT